MRDIIDDRFTPPPADRPLAAHQQMEVDCFCDGCGYNLHGQQVERDPRLNLSVCRCPECGRWHAAGKGVSAASAWLNRLGVYLLAGWVLAVIATVLTLGFLLGTWPYVHGEATTTSMLMTRDGRRVENAHLGAGGFGKVIAGTGEPATDVGYFRVVRTTDMVVGPGSHPGARERYESQQRVMIGVFLSLAVATGVVLGGLCTIVLWHVPRRRVASVAAMPVLAAAVAWAMYVYADRGELIAGWFAGWCAAYAAVGVAGTLLGLRVGRPVARFLVKVIVPPKPRQVLAFLWRADGLEPPPAKGAGA